MDCLDARAALSPEEALRLATHQVLEARRHVERCDDCQDALALDRALQKRLRALGQAQAPAEVRERVFDAVARVRAGWPDGSGRAGARRPGLAPALGGLAAMVMITVLGFGFGLFPGGLMDPAPPTARLEGMRSAPGSAQASAFVEDFLRRAVQAEHIQTSDPGEVARFLTRELGIPGYMGLNLPPEDLDLQGAEICIVDGVRGAVVVYKKGGRVLYHYLIPRPGAEPRAPAALGMGAAPDPSPFEGPGAGGPNVGTSGGGTYPSVVTWASVGMEEALVGDLSVASLLDVAGPRAP